MRVLKKFCLGICVIIVCAMLYVPVTAYADKAHIYFYTVDDEEISQLRMTAGKGRTFTLKDPQQYAFIEHKGKVPEIASEVTGIAWIEYDEDGNIINTYHNGETYTCDGSSHYLYVQTDHPELTEENTRVLSYGDEVHVYFEDDNGDEIINGGKELAYSIAPMDTITFPNPADYCSEGATASKWYCQTDGRLYLISAGQKVSFKAGDYTFAPLTRETITISYYYPDGDYEYIAGIKTNDDGDYECVDGVSKNGRQYAAVEAKIGDTITLKGSLGSIIWGYTFQGWEKSSDYGEEDDGEIYDGKATFKVNTVHDIDFTAVYEEDDDWDPFAEDENTGAVPAEGNKFVDTQKINEMAGAGYEVKISADGTLQRTAQKLRINSQTDLTGIPMLIRPDTSLTSLKPGGDPENPEDYKYDKYGNPNGSTDLPVTMQNVLKQDDSAMYMDTYGNSFIYIPEMSRVNNMKYAVERLSEGKGDSWVTNLSADDQDRVKRFEAVEFALLSGQYPKEGETLTDGVTWENQIGKKAFNALLNYKKIWRGWADEYADGLYDKYMNMQDDGTVVVGSADTGSTLRRLVRAFTTPASITAYADTTGNTRKEKNANGSGSRAGARTNETIDISGYLFKPQYYKESTFLGSFGLYMLGPLGNVDLTEEGKQNLIKCFNAIVGAGYSAAFAAGACGNIWQESHFIPTCGSLQHAYGLVQWMGGRLAGLQSKAAEWHMDASSAECQIKYMIYEMDGGYQRPLVSSGTIVGGYGTIEAVRGISNAIQACNIFCRAIEGCVRSGAPTKNDAKIGNQWYQELLLRQGYATQVASVIQGVSIGASFSGKWQPPANGSNNKVVYYSQNDPAWNQLPYPYDAGGSSTIGKSACGVASAAMVLSYWTGQEITPVALLDTVEQHTGNRGYYHASGGTKYSFFADIAPWFGLKCRAISGQKAIDAALAAKHPVIQICHSGSIFTRNGHYIVITGKDLQGNYWVNDPNMRNQHYNYEPMTFSKVTTGCVGWWEFYK